MNIERLILNKLLTNEIYARKYFSFLKNEYFTNELVGNSYKYYNDIYIIYRDHFEKYDNIPLIDDMILHLKDYVKYENRNDYTEIMDGIKKEIMITYNYNKVIEDKLLFDKTEKWIKDCELEIAIRKSIDIYEQDSRTSDDNSLIADMITQAIGVSFDEDLGTEFTDLDRLKPSKNDGTKIPFLSNTLNILTNGGAETKAINIIAMAQNGGKTRFMCWLAQGYIKQGYDVLYITMEMAENKIYNYVDSAFFELDITKSDDVDIREYKYNKLKECKSRVKDGKLGRLVVKKFPIKSIHAIDIKNYINRLRLVKNFKPKVVFVDYLQIIKSFKAGRLALDKTHHIYGETCIELRSVAEDYDLCMWTASQFNKDGANTNNFDAYNLKGSTDISNNADFMLGGYASEENLKDGIVQFGVMKTRYNIKTFMKDFTMGLNEKEMRFYDLIKYGDYDNISNTDKKNDIYIPLSSKVLKKSDKEILRIAQNKKHNEKNKSVTVDSESVIIDNSVLSDDENLVTPFDEFDENRGFYD